MTENDPRTHSAPPADVPSSAELEAAYRCFRRICADGTGASARRLRTALLDAARAPDPTAARARLAAVLAEEPEAPTPEALTNVGVWLLQDLGAWAGADAPLAYGLFDADGQPRGRVELTPGSPAPVASYCAADGSRVPLSYSSGQLREAEGALAIRLRPLFMHRDPSAADSPIVRALAGSVGAQPVAGPVMEFSADDAQRIALAVLPWLQYFAYFFGGVTALTALVAGVYLLVQFVRTGGRQLPVMQELDDAVLNRWIDDWRGQPWLEDWPDDDKLSALGESARKLSESLEEDGEQDAPDEDGGPGGQQQPQGQVVNEPPAENVPAGNELIQSAEKLLQDPDEAGELLESQYVLLESQYVEIEKAVKELPPKQQISRAERAEQRAALDTRMAEIKAEIAGLRTANMSRAEIAKQRVALEQERSELSKQLEALSRMETKVTRKQRAPEPVGNGEQGQAPDPEAIATQQKQQELQQIGDNADLLRSQAQFGVNPSLEQAARDTRQQFQQVQAINPKDSQALVALQQQEEGIVKTNAELHRDDLNQSTNLSAQQKRQNQEAQTQFDADRQAIKGEDEPKKDTQTHERDGSEHPSEARITE